MFDGIITQSFEMIKCTLFKIVRFSEITKTKQDQNIRAAAGLSAEAGGQPRQDWRGGRAPRGGIHPQLSRGCQGQSSLFRK